MKKILTALMLFCAVALFANPAQNQANVQENDVTTAQVATHCNGDKNKCAIAENTACQNSDVEVKANVDAKQKLTPEERNKKTKEADGYGLGITAMSMIIVITALVILSFLFFIFGKISQLFHKKKKMETYGIKQDDENQEATSGEAMAAIAAAIHEHFNSRHDIEDTVLTIRKLKRAYSPWSSKLYSLRQVPQRDNWHR